MTEKRHGLGRGLGALIPTGTDGGGYGWGQALQRGEELRSRIGDVSRETSPIHRVIDLATAPLIGRSDAEITEPALTLPELRSVPGVQFAMVPIDAICPNTRQPRGQIDEDELAELVHSLQHVGMLQPIVVRPVSGAVEGSVDHPGSRSEAETGSRGQPTPEVQPQQGFELVVGERRWRAAQTAGWTEVPAIVKDTPDDDMLRDALLENLHRVQLNPLEEAAAYQQLLDDFGCRHEELAERLGRSRPQITNTLRLLKLPPLVGRRLAAGVISAGHARALLGLSDTAAMERMAQRIVAEGLTVRTVEELVTQGEGAKPAVTMRGPQPRPVDPHLNDIASQLMDRLDTRVSIAMGKRKGKLTVEFASVDDLHRILQSLGAQAVA